MSIYLFQCLNLFCFQLYKPTHAKQPKVDRILQPELYYRKSPKIYKIISPILNPNLLGIPNSATNNFSISYLPTNVYFYCYICILMNFY